MSEGLRILVLGGTRFNDGGEVFSVLSRIMVDETIDLIITGGGPGAELAARSFAFKRNLSQLILLPKRNNSLTRAEQFEARDLRLLDEGKPDLIIGFRCGAGAYRIIDRAEKLGMTILMASEAEGRGPEGRGAEEDG